MGAQSPAATHLPCTAGHASTLLYSLLHLTGIGFTPEAIAAAARAQLG